MVIEFHEWGETAAAVVVVVVNYYLSKSKRSNQGGEMQLHKQLVKALGPKPTNGKARPN